MASYEWAKVRFTKDCTYDYRPYAAGEEPDQWFPKWKAEQIAANGDGEITSWMGVDTAKEQADPEQLES